MGLTQAVLLLAAAQGIYFGSSTTYGSFLGELERRKRHAVLFGFFVALAAFVVFYSAAFPPTTTGTATDFVGNVVPSVSVASNLLVFILVLYVFFLAYPTALMLLGVSRVEDKRMRRSLFGLGLGWAGVSGLYVLAASYMWTYCVDANGIMYAANSVIFFVVMRNFRMSATLAGFVERPVPSAPAAAAPPGRMSRLTESLARKKLLYDVDPGVPYETTLRRTLEELARAGHTVFVFTPKASPLNMALAGGTGMKFFLTTSEVSYMKVVDENTEVLIPQSDTPIFLDVVDKALASRKENVVFVFDSVTDLLVMAGLRQTYKFLKQFLELLHEPRSTGFFLFIKKAHASKDAKLLAGLFASHFVEDKEGARLPK